MSYNNKSKENLVPFKKGFDARRQPGRKKGSSNMKTIVKSLLEEDISPELIFSPKTRERFESMRDSTFLEAITLTLVNQSLCGNIQASNILLRELRKIEESEPKQSKFDKCKQMEITVVTSEEEIKKLNELEQRLKKHNL